MEHQHKPLWHRNNIAAPINGSLLILLVFRSKIVQVRLGFSELYFVQTPTNVPMQESHSPDHSSELFRNALEQFLDCSYFTQRKEGKNSRTSGRKLPS